MEVDGSDRHVRHDEHTPLLPTGPLRPDTAGLPRTSSDSRDRFVYRPRNILERLATGTILRSALKRSELVRIPYRRSLKYLLILFLVLLSIASTPTLLSRRVGFEPLLKSSFEICQDRSEKLDALKTRMEALTNLGRLRERLQEHNFQSRCFNQSAAAYYRRPERLQWPDECTMQRAGSEALNTEVCVGPSEQNSCMKLNSLKRLLGGMIGACRAVTIEKTCRTVVDGLRASELEELERLSQLRVQEDLKAGNDTVVLNTANEKVSSVITGLLARVDAASNLYIAYNVVTLFIGTPLVLYKRSTTARMMGVAFGMRKTVFIFSVVISLTVYDALSVILNQLDFVTLLRNFRNDACYVDIRFSQARIELVLEMCAQVSEISRKRDAALQQMDSIYYLTRRFALCGRPKDEHPQAHLMDLTRRRYRDGDLAYQAICNVTLLEKMTASPLVDDGGDDGSLFPTWTMLLSSGIVAQIFLKVILSSWLVHMLAFIEPMIVHNGKVEVWDFGDREQAGGVREEESPIGRRSVNDSPHERRPIELNEREKSSVIGFARDRHLFPLVMLSLMLIADVALMMHSTRSLWSTPPIPAAGKGERRQWQESESNAGVYECLVKPP